MKIQNPFRLGLYGGLGVLLAIVIGEAVHTLSTIITYVGAALFLSLGIDPIISWLERHRMKRGVAILITLVVILGVVAGLVVALIPVIVEQTNLIAATINNDILPLVKSSSGFTGFLTALFPWADQGVVTAVSDAVTSFFGDSKNIATISNGAINFGVQTASGLFGAVIVIILVIYFVSSLGSVKRGLYQLVPASKRETFIDLAEQISQAVGRYVIGQVALALCNGVLSAIFLSIIGIKYSIVLAFIAFIGSLIPLVGTISATVINVLATLLFMGFDWHVIVVAIYYLVYMQVEAYVLNPRIMNRAVKVPGVVVVLAALIGGTLLGILGALIAIPVAASILLIVKQVLVPRQNEL